jgi:hypothetical protein
MNLSNLQMRCIVNINTRLATCLVVFAWLVGGTGCAKQDASSAIQEGSAGTGALMEVRDPQTEPELESVRARNEVSDAPKEELLPCTADELGPQEPYEEPVNDHISRIAASAKTELKQRERERLESELHDAPSLEQAEVEAAPTELLRAQAAYLEASTSVSDDDERARMKQDMLGE